VLRIHLAPDDLAFILKLGAEEPTVIAVVWSLLKCRGLDVGRELYPMLVPVRLCT